MLQRDAVQWNKYLHNGMSRSAFKARNVLHLLKKYVQL